MDVISFSEAATANSRIEIINANPDSNSGVLTQPKVIEAGETVTIKSGRQAILADTVVDGDLVIEAGGDVFVPAGAGFGDLDQRIDTLESTKQDNLVVNDLAVKTALNATGAAPIYACRAWVNFNGTGTVAIRASGNVSSITDNGLGLYTVNFTTAMVDANYSAVFGAWGNSGSASWSLWEDSTTTRTAYGLRIGATYNQSSQTLPADYQQVNVSIIR